MLDAGSGTGVLGVCAAGALMDLKAPSLNVRAQDRDDLARLFTECNARRNGISEDILTAHTEPLLAGPGEWDIILTNIPAKAGLPVLEDFVRRSAALLKKDGQVFLVAVNTLADFFRSQITASAGLVAEKKENEHTVFVYRKSSGGTGETNAAPPEGPIVFDENFLQSYPFYIRNRSEYAMEDICYRLDTVHGAADFDNPGGAVQAAARLALKIKLAEKLKTALAKNSAGDEKTAMLIYDAGQGHFSAWLNHYLKTAAPQNYRWVLSGRNALALAPAGYALASGAAKIIPCADIFLDRERLSANGNGFGLIAFFPEAVSETDRREANWQGLKELSAPDCIIISGMSSAEAERFDRKKPAGFVRLGDIKRKGFRAMAYQKH